MLSKTQLYNKSTPCIRRGIVYFLFKRKEIVYVGSTLNLWVRLDTHKKVKDFDRFTFVWCDEYERIPKPLK